jgi:hypothetical protein
MRLLIFLAIVYLGYRALKSWMFKHVNFEKTGTGKSTGEIDDIMVKDPYCEVYFPKRNGIRVRIDGEYHFFCSTECRDKYMSSRSQKNM